MCEVVNGTPDAQIMLWSIELNSSNDLKMVFEIEKKFKNSTEIIGLNTWQHSISEPNQIRTKKNEKKGVSI